MYFLEQRKEHRLKLPNMYEIYQISSVCGEATITSLRTHALVLITKISFTYLIVLS